MERKGVQESLRGLASPVEESELREEEKRPRGSGAGDKGSRLVEGSGGMEGVSDVSSEAVSTSVVSSISPSAGMSSASANGTLLSSSFSLSSLSSSRVTIAYTPRLVLLSLTLRGTRGSDSGPEASESESLSEFELESLGSPFSSSWSGA